MMSYIEFNTLLSNFYIIIIWRNTENTKNPVSHATESMSYVIAVQQCVLGKHDREQMTMPL
jgi:hypothetical protein